VELLRRYSSRNENYYWFEIRDAKGTGWLYGEFLKPGAGGNAVPRIPEINNRESEDIPAAERGVINTSQ
jgi:hypothetical protein